MLERSGSIKTVTTAVEAYHQALAARKDAAGLAEAVKALRKADATLGGKETAARIEALLRATPRKASAKTTTKE